MSRLASPIPSQDPSHESGRLRVASAAPRTRPNWPSNCATASNAATLCKLKCRTHKPPWLLCARNWTAPPPTVCWHQPTQPCTAPSAHTARWPLPQTPAALDVGCDAGAACGGGCEGCGSASGGCWAASVLSHHASNACCPMEPSVVPNALFRWVHQTVGKRRHSKALTPPVTSAANTHNTGLLCSDGRQSLCACDAQLGGVAGCKASRNRSRDAASRAAGVNGKEPGGVMGVQAIVVVKPGRACARPQHPAPTGPARLARAARRPWRAAKPHSTGPTPGAQRARPTAPTSARRVLVA